MHRSNVQLWKKKSYSEVQLQQGHGNPQMTGTFCPIEVIDFSYETQLNFHTT